MNISEITDRNSQIPNYINLQYKSVEEIETGQMRLLKEHISYAYENSPFYKRKFIQAGIKPENIRTIEDLQKIPFTDKDEINLYNDKFLAVDMNEIVDICLTSATTGKEPTRLLQTGRDLARLAYNEEIAFKMAGVTERDILFDCATLDRCFMAGMAYFLGSVQLGACTIRGGSRNAAQLWESIKFTNPTVLVGVPSLFRRIADYAVDLGEDPSQTSIKKLIAIGEPVRDAELALLPVASKLEKLWGADLYSTYASSEMATTFCECEARQGGHVRPELIVPEIIDETGKTVADGEKGELVITPLGVQGMPLIRFRTGDITYLIKEKCSCGRNTRRIAPVLGRKNQMLKYKGTTIFPNAILSAIEDIDDYYGGFVEARTNADYTDNIVLYISSRTDRLDKQRIAERLRARLRVVPEIRIITVEKLKERIYVPGKRKKVTFYDLRKRI